MASNRGGFFGLALVVLASTAAYFTIIGIFEMPAAIICLALFIGVVFGVWRSDMSAADGRTQ
ncbi:MAG: hypothetical protein JWQ76_5671 [Ramlibacter sp.]|nr:hypothetical protein [Ramlibacter sp.]